MTAKTLRKPSRVLVHLTIKTLETSPGLSAVNEILLQNEGWMEIDGEPEPGDSSKIHPPNAGDAARKTETTAVETSPARRTATVLVVEDQAAIRRLAEEVLSEAGHTVLSAPNGRVALDLATEYEGEIDLLVTDVVMPELNGPELVAQLSRSRPGTRVLYISGFVGDAIDPRAVQNGHSAFLKKPFLPSVLAEKVSSLLGKQRGDDAGPTSDVQS
jgi:two-component system, cell cycle sensor histidine kinase and response regulator CckA